MMTLRFAFTMATAFAFAFFFHDYLDLFIVVLFVVTSFASSLVTVMVVIAPFALALLLNDHFDLAVVDLDVVVLDHEADALVVTPVLFFIIFFVAKTFALVGDHFEIFAMAPVVVAAVVTATAFMVTIAVPVSL